MPLLQEQDKTATPIRRMSSWTIDWQVDYKMLSNIWNQTFAVIYYDSGSLTDSISLSLTCFWIQSCLSLSSDVMLCWCLLRLCLSDHEWLRVCMCACIGVCENVSKTSSDSPCAAIIFNNCHFHYTIFPSTHMSFAFFSIQKCEYSASWRSPVRCPCNSQEPSKDELVYFSLPVPISLPPIRSYS